MMGRPTLLLILFEICILFGTSAIFLIMHSMISRFHITELSSNSGHKRVQKDLRFPHRSDKGYKYQYDNDSKDTYVYQAIEMLKTAQLEILSIQDSSNIRNAIEVLTSMINTNEKARIDTKSLSQNKRNTNDSTALCPEVHVPVDPSIGWSYFKQSAECNEVNRKYIERHVTILLNFASYGPIDSPNVHEVVKGIFAVFPNISVVLAGQKHHLSQLSNFTDLDNLKMSLVQPGENTGKIWNHIIKSVRTRYVLIGHDLVDFDDDVRLERLLMEMQLLNMTVMGEYRLRAFEV